MKTIGAYEAKTHLPRLLDEVSHGERITITRHGTAVAVLVAPDRSAVDRSGIRQAIAALRSFRKNRGLGAPLRELIEEGRH